MHIGVLSTAANKSMFGQFRLVLIKFHCNPRRVENKLDAKNLDAENIYLRCQDPPSTKRVQLNFPAWLVFHDGTRSSNKFGDSILLQDKCLFCNQLWILLEVLFLTLWSPSTTYQTFFIRGSEVPSGSPSVDPRKPVHCPNWWSAACFGGPKAILGGLDINNSTT